ncbi:MAG: efflux RND transporter periplasmic adaptor subunit [Clostridia bacterium]
MLQRMLMIVMILVIVIGGGFYAYKELMPPAKQAVQGPVYATREVVKGDIDVKVEAVGRLDPSDDGAIRVGGGYRGGFQAVIEEFFIKEGEAVKQGQVVAKLSAVELLKEIDRIKDELEEKRRQLSEMSRIPIEELSNLNPMKGIIITSPIDGVVNELEVEEGSKLEEGASIARIVDSSKYKVEVHLYEGEYKRIKEGQKVVLRFPYFDEEYEGTITHINPNRIPYNKGDGSDKNENFAQGFVYLVMIEADNMGLVQRDMEVRVGIRSEEDNVSIYYVANTGKVSEFLKEERLMNTSVEAVVTKVHVQNMATVNEGDPIITMSGSDIETKLQSSIELIRRLESQLEDLNTNLQFLEVKAPMDGIVAEINEQPGTEVWPGQWIGRLYTVSNMMLYTQVDDIDIIHIKQEAPVRVTVDALANKELKGEVQYIEPRGQDSGQGISKFPVIIKVEGTPELRPGMKATAHIDVGSAKDVLLVPVEAIFDEEGKSMVEIMREDGVTTEVVPVQVGLMNDKMGEIISGLKEGDKVVVGTSAELMPSEQIETGAGLLPDRAKENNEDVKSDDASE